MNISKTASQIRDEMSDTARQVGELGRKAGEKLDDVRCGAAEVLANAASSVRATGRQGSDAVDELTRNTADKLDSSAAYVLHHDLGDMLGTVRQVIRRHPASAIVGAAAFGFLLGSALLRPSK